MTLDEMPSYGGGSDVAVLGTDSCDKLDVRTLRTMASMVAPVFETTSRSAVPKYLRHMPLQSRSSMEIDAIMVVRT